MCSCVSGFFVLLVYLLDIQGKNNTMKNKFLSSLMSLALLAAVASCDNGNADFSVVDTDPTVEIGALTGVVEGETFTAALTFGDGAEGSSVSTLASGSWSITSGGAEVASGTLAPAGDNWTGALSATGLVEGDHSLTVSATDSNGNTGSASTDFSIVGAIADITGTWILKPAAGSVRVGSFSGGGDYFSFPAGFVTDRACYYDDTYTFNADGSFVIDMQTQTFLEDWQGTNFACAAPAAPYVSGTYGYSFNGQTMVVTGAGAFIGLPKVHNTGELPNVPQVGTSITYEVASATTTTMDLRIRVGGDGAGWWTYELIKQ
ncbi:MAG: hypothetical protein ACJAVN_001769 [Roseivirga sp.]|jgi:hypothetical protein